MSKKDNLSHFLSDHGFVLAKSNTSTSFVNYCEIFAKADIQVRFIGDKSILYLELRKSNLDIQWFDLQIIKVLVGSDNTFDKHGEFDELSDFLQNNFAKTIDFMENRNYPDTKPKLENLQRLRSEQLFPNWFRQ